MTQSLTALRATAPWMTAVLMVVFSGCSESPTTPTAATEKAATKGIPTSFELSTEAVAKSELGLETAGKHDMRLSLTMPAQIIIDDTRSAHVVTTLSGTIREVRKQLGERVQAGEVLATMDSRELADAATLYVSAKAHVVLATAVQERANLVAANTTKLRELLEKQSDLQVIDEAMQGAPIGENRVSLITAYARLRAAKITFEREKVLFDKKISPAADFALAEEEFSSAKARYAAALEETSYTGERIAKEANQAAVQATLDLTTARQKLRALGLSDDDVAGFTTDSQRAFTHYDIKAPISGTVVERHVELGEAVGADRDAFFIANLTDVIVQMSVTADQLAHVKAGHKIIVHAATGPEATTELSYLSPIIDDKTGMAVARARIPNPEGVWRPGLFVSAEFIIDEQAAAIAVQTDAIQEINGAPVVFVQDGKNFRVVPVKIGRRDATITELLDGSTIAEGDRYVVRNSFVLKAHLLSLGGG